MSEHKNVGDINDTIELSILMGLAKDSKVSSDWVRFCSTQSRFQPSAKRISDQERESD